MSISNHPFEHLGRALFLATHDICLHFHKPRIYRRDAQWEKISPEDREFFVNAAEKHFTNLIIGSEKETTH
ncbi:hypothetical protein C6503_19170 [Candidatus Poribacteria bacterium]|nr:MAG: hypothetical protein C6503_19170 [Candidatus Poribacteria bacterium]